MDNARALGGRITKARTDRGLNRNQLARELGTSWQLVDRWEKGKTLPNPASLRRLAEVLNISVDSLLGPTANDLGKTPNKALAEFTRVYAPKDLTPAEIEWLEQAPIGSGQPTPGDYADMIHTLRRANRHRASDSGEFSSGEHNSWQVSKGAAGKD